MKPSISNNIWKNKRSSSVGRVNNSIKSLLAGHQSISFKQLKRRSSKVEQNKQVLLNPRIKRRTILKNHPLISNGHLIYPLSLTQAKVEDAQTKKQFLMSANPVMSSALKQFLKPDFEKKESLYEILERTQKLPEYLKKFGNPFGQTEKTRLWTQKVSDIQRTVNTSVYNSGIISKMLIH